MDVGPVGTGESKVKRSMFLRGKQIISVVGSNVLSFYAAESYADESINFVDKQLYLFYSYIEVSGNLYPYSLRIGSLWHIADIFT